MENTAELFNIQESAEEKTNLGFSKEEIENTPFEVLHLHDKGYCLIWGQFRLSEIKGSKEEVTEELERKKWGIMMTVAGIIAEKVVLNAKNN